MWASAFDIGGPARGYAEWGADNDMSLPPQVIREFKRHERRERQVVPEAEAE